MTCPRFIAPLRIWVVALALALLPVAWAQTPEERIRFDAAARALSDGFAEKAADDFAEFQRLNPESPLAAEAGLFEARARFELGQLERAALLLTDGGGRMGGMRDQALYLLGEIQLRQGAFLEAARAFGTLTAELPTSPLVLKAGLGEALAWYRAGDYIRAAALLGSGTNAFARAAAGQPNDEMAIRGQLLLADAQLRSGAGAAAQTSLDQLTNRTLTPAQAWDRQWLVTSILLTNRQTDAALVATSNLLVVANTSASRDLIARSHALRGDVLQRAGRPAEAFATLTNNLADTAPPEWRRDALLAVAELPLPLAQVDPAIRLLSALTAGPATDPAAGAARVAVAELRLQQHFANPEPAAAAGGPLAEARSLLQGVVSNSAAPTVLGRAWYDLGWTDVAAGRGAAATDAFGRAAGILPPSRLQAMALFKLADGQMAAKNHALALTNYLRVIREYGDGGSLRGAVLERALYQGALAALESGQQVLANELARRAVVEFPNGEFRDDTRVLYGQTLARLDPPVRAREALRQLATRLVNSPAMPEIQLALARSYLRERSWSNALHQLDDWTRSYPTHAGIARAEFERGWAAFKSGDEGRAYGLLTNFLARFPEDPAAPQAQFWVGDHLYSLGNYAGAEAGYQLVFQRTNWPVSPLTHEARLMAGRAAFARQGYRDAKDYFRWLITNGPPAVTNSTIPPDLVPRAYFALGDGFLLEPESDDKLSDAMNAFATVIEKFPTSREALLARGKLAACHLQRAELVPNQAIAAYTNAASLYLQVLESPQADIAARSQAEVGLGLVREKQAARAAGAEREALLKEALSRQLNVFNRANLRTNETASPFWLNRAGVEAARLAEAAGMRPQAAQVYERLAETFPASATAFRQRAVQLRNR